MSRKVSSFFPVSRWNLISLRPFMLIFAVAVVVLFLGVAEDGVTAKSLFQSPQPTPVPTNTPVPPPTSVPATTPVPPPTSVPATTPVPPPTSVPATTPVPPPTSVPATTPVPPAPIPDSGETTTVQSTTEQTTTKIVTDTIQATEEALQPDQPPPPVDFVPDNGGTSNLTVDQVELIDSIVVSSAYIWLCFGVAIFLIVPILLLILQIRGSSKVKKAERF